MTRQWLAIGVVAVALVSGCGSPRSAAKAEQTAHWAGAHGDGYRRADQPEAIADLVEHYAIRNGGDVLAREVRHGPRPSGHVDVLFHLEGGKWESDAWECWRFSFSKPENDEYVREIKFDEIKCPKGVKPSG